MASPRELRITLVIMALVAAALLFLVVNAVLAQDPPDGNGESSEENETPAVEMIQALTAALDHLAYRIDADSASKVVGPYLAHSSPLDEESSSAACAQYNIDGDDNGAIDRSEIDTATIDLVAGRISPDTFLAVYGCYGSDEATQVGGQQAPTPTPTPPPVQIARLTISGLGSSIGWRSSRPFTVRASNLNRGFTYTIQVTTHSNHIGFNNSCSDREETESVEDRTSYNLGLTLHGCRVGNGLVFALVTASGPITFPVTAVKQVTVRLPPTSRPRPTSTPRPTPTPTPGPPRNLEVTPSYGHTNYPVFVATWDAPNTGGEVKYYAFEYLWKYGSANYPRITTRTMTVNAQLMPMTYTVKVKACNSAGCGDSISEEELIPARPYRMKAPTVTPGDQTIRVEWEIPMKPTGSPADGEDPINRFELQHKKASDGPELWSEPTIFGFNTEEFRNRSAILGGLTNSVLYEVQVTACNRAGCGPWSNSSSETPESVPTQYELPFREPSRVHFIVVGKNSTYGVAFMNNKVTESWLSKDEKNTFTSHENDHTIVRYPPGSEFTGLWVRTVYFRNGLIWFTIPNREWHIYVPFLGDPDHVYWGGKNREQETLRSASVNVAVTFTAYWGGTWTIPDVAEGEFSFPVSGGFGGDS